MRKLQEVITDLENRKKIGDLSPVDVGNFLVELVPHHNELLKTLDEALHLQAVAMAGEVNAGKPATVAKMLVDAREISKTVRAAKTDVAFVEEYISSLKYLARAYEKEYQYAKA